MLKRKILAIAIPALLAAGAANAAQVYNQDGNKVDLYGQVTAEFDFNGNNNVANSYDSVTKKLDYYSNNNRDEDASYARLGFKGETQINSQLTGYGQFEHEFGATNRDHDTKEDTRLAFVGLKYADFGSLDLGRNYGVVYDVGAYTDVLPQFGGDAWTQTDNYMTARTSGVATYRNTNFFDMVDGWDFALQYQVKNENDDDSTKANGEGFGVSTSYDFGYGISGVASYAGSKRIYDQQKDNKGEHAEVWAVGAKYDANNVYLAATYAETHNMTSIDSTSCSSNSPSMSCDAIVTNYSEDVANKARGIELVAKYNFDFGLTPAISYAQLRGSDLTGNPVVNGYSTANLVKYVSVGANYSFNKNMSTAVGYKINLLDKTDNYAMAQGLRTDDQVVLGVTYQF
jgi:predicted porin